MAAPISLIGVPTSAGAFAPGQERAPAELRRAGLADRLREEGRDVNDRGDSPVWRWRPDPEHPRAQNVGAVVASVRDTATRVEQAGHSRELALVLGGDCTIELGTIAGHLAGSDDIGLVYFDVHPDLNTPDSVRPGALDWMGMAHALAVEGATPELVEVGPRTPLLADDQVLFFAYGPEQARPFELEVMEERGLERVSVDEVAADPGGAAGRVISGFASRFERLLVHFDVDTIDFNDAPLSENTGRGEGLAFDTAMRALEVLCASERLSSLTVTELNPLHGDEEGLTLRRFADALAGSFGAAGGD